MTAISGSTTASFVYDALGRRESKTISKTSTSFLYDGLNLEQELKRTTPTVNYLTGAGIDETLSRTDSKGTSSYLTDNLGSTLALTSSAGAISTSYSYEPYGNTTASGTSSTNTIQYTRRENDGTGLYYYRARYYSPGYGRFISEDPLGFLGGINLYGYVGGNPIYFSDPLGLADWAQFSIGGYSGPEMQAIAEGQSAQAQLQNAQNNALNIEILAAPCLAAQFIRNYKMEFNSNATTAQRLFGPWELYQDITELAHHAGAAGAGYLTEQGLDQAAIYAAGAGSTNGVARMIMIKTGVKFIGQAPLVFGAGLDTGDALNSTFNALYYGSYSCCSR